MSYFFTFCEKQETKSLTTNSTTSKTWMKLIPKYKDTAPPKLDKKVKKVYSGFSATVSTSKLP